MNNTELLKREIEEIVAESFSKTDSLHSKNTLEWLLRLNPNADEALQIAALAHDIERGAREKENNFDAENFENYDKSKKEHSKRSSELICKLLTKYEFKIPFINKVGHLVLYHEVGGDEETDALKDADSLSYFDTNINLYLEKHGKETTFSKIKYMFDRMSEKSKNLARQFRYENQELNELFRDALGISIESETLSK